MVKGVLLLFFYRSPDVSVRLPVGGNTANLTAKRAKFAKILPLRFAFFANFAVI